MRKIKIVYLDDHSVYRNGVQACIDPNKERFFFMHFGHADDALRYIKNSFDNNCKIDLIITDYNHPGINGYQFAKEVRALEKLHNKKTPIFLISFCEKSMTEPIQIGLAEGVFNYCLGKNAEVPDILHAIDYLLSKDGKREGE